MRASGIFLAGDCDVDVPVLHEASTEGAIAGNNAALFPHVRILARSTPRAITFSDSPSASIGKPAGKNTIIGEGDFSNQVHAKIEAMNAGIVRIYADSNGFVTRAAMAAPESEHMAHLIAWAIEKRQCNSGKCRSTILSMRKGSAPHSGRLATMQNCISVPSG